MKVRVDFHQVFAMMYKKENFLCGNNSRLKGHICKLLCGEHCFSLLGWYTLKRGNRSSLQRSGGQQFQGRDAQAFMAKICLCTIE